MSKPGHIQKKFQGISSHRYKGNPLEKRFAAMWQEANSFSGSSRQMLSYLLDPTNIHLPNPPSDRDWLVAATVIQWLGSP